MLAGGYYTVVRIQRSIFAHDAVAVLQPDVSNLLTLRVGRHVFDVDARVDVPVNAVAKPELRHAAADVHDEARRRARVLLVVPELGHDLDLVAVERLRRVAMLARLVGRTQVGDGRRNRPRVRPGRHADELSDAVDLRLHEPRRTRPDVAFDTR